MRKACASAIPTISVRWCSVWVTSRPSIATAATITANEAMLERLRS
jgi:hypothetical protein